MKYERCAGAAHRGGGGTQMVNYRVVDGDCYVVDRLFDKACFYRAWAASRTA